MKDKKTLDQILHLLKTEGSLTAGDLGKLPNIMSMGSRGHLEKLMDKAMVGTRTIRSGVGRPRKTWHLTHKAHSQFPDCHDQLTLDMIISIKEVGSYWIPDCSTTLLLRPVDNDFNNDQNYGTHQR